MNRRKLLKHTLLLSASALIPLSKLVAAKHQPAAGSHHYFKLGTLELFIVTDGHILFPSVQPSFAPGADSAAVNHLLKNSFLPTDHADLSMNILIIKTGHKVILVDTGCGPLFGRNSGWLNQSLLQVGIRPQQVTDIVLTHAHPDHIGGLLTRQGDLVFKQAKIHLSNQEHDFWTQLYPDLSKSKMNDKATKKLIIDTAQLTIAKAKKQLQLFDDGDILLDCVKVQLAPGHTPGHTILTVFSEGQELVHTGDLVHSPVLVFAHPEWGFDGDTDFELATKTRKVILEQLAQARKQVFSYHLPWPGIGHVRKQGDGYEWVANNFAIPG